MNLSPGDMVVFNPTFDTIRRRQGIGIVIARSDQLMTRFVTVLWSGPDPNSTIDLVSVDSLVRWGRGL